MCISSDSVYCLVLVQCINSIRTFQLAKDAGSEVAMTDEEKIRVEGLLKDLDELPEVLEDEVRNIILLLQCL